MLELTDERGDTFYLNVDLVERITDRLYRGGSAIYLTTGRWVECIEPASKIALMVTGIKNARNWVENVDK